MEQSMQISGANKLAERIVEDAVSDARTLGAESEKALAAVKAEFEKSFAAREAEYAEKRSAAVNGVLEGARTRAQLSGRMTTLEKKRAVLESCFASAYDAVEALDAPKRQGVLKALLLRELEGGEVVAPAKADRALLTEILAEMGKDAPALAKEDASVESGFVLLGDGYEKDCSLGALLAELRQNEETKVASLLFE